MVRPVKYLACGVFAACLLGAAFSSSLTAEDAPAFVYDSRGKRDPFIPLVTPQQPKISAGLENIRSPEDIVLEGIVWEPGGNSIAILNGTIMTENQKIGNVMVVSIYKKSIRLLIDDVEYTIDLITEGEEANEGR